MQKSTQHKYKRIIKKYSRLEIISVFTMIHRRQAVHREFSREAKFAHFAFRVNDPATLSFFVRSFARGLSALLKSSWFYAHAYNPSTVRLVLLSRGWYLATITCVKLSHGPITHVESYGQVHKSWRTGSCLPFGNCKCYYLYLVKCLFLFLFVCSVVALVLSLFCPEGYPV